MARRTITAEVASTRHRTAVVTKAGLSENGSTKFDVTPDGGASAGTALLGVLKFIILSMKSMKKAYKRYSRATTNIWEVKGLGSEQILGRLYYEYLTIAPHIFSWFWNTPICCLLVSKGTVPHHDSTKTSSEEGVVGYLGATLS